jgi:hypothetical protein
MKGHGQTGNADANSTINEPATLAVLGSLNTSATGRDGLELAHDTKTRDVDSNGSSSSQLGENVAVHSGAYNGVFLPDNHIDEVVDVEEKQPEDDAECWEIPCTPVVREREKHQDCGKETADS